MEQIVGVSYEDTSKYCTILPLLTASLHMVNTCTLHASTVTKTSCTGMKRKEWNRSDHNKNPFQYFNSRFYMYFIILPIEL